MQGLMVEHNPWWKGLPDPHLSAWQQRRRKWVPKWIDNLSLKPFSLNFVIGPRQVGKTTGLKLLISKLLKQVAPEQVFYFNCDFLPDVHSMERVFRAYLEFRRAAGHRTSYIFLDEVTSVRGWWRVVKGHIDLGVLAEDVVIVTGSGSLKLAGDVELFPGRQGHGVNLSVWPLSFREFLQVHGVEIEFRGSIEADMKRAWTREAEIRNLFARYLRLGGFPASVNEDPRAGEDLVRSLEGEVLRLGRSLQLVREILASVFSKAPAPLSYSTIARDTSGYSYKTVAEYLEVLRNLMILGLAQFREERIRYRKEKKVFLLDPFLAQALSRWSGQEFLPSALYEWVVQAHLLRRFGEVFYFRDSYEIDCIAGDMKIEIKAGKPHRRYPKGVRVLSESDLPLFLAVL